MGWPGLGPLLLEAILARDLHLVLGPVLVSTLFLLVGNLARRPPAARGRPAHPRGRGVSRPRGGARGARGAGRRAPRPPWPPGSSRRIRPPSRTARCPTRRPPALRFVDADGRFHAAPFVYAIGERDGAPGAYEEDRTPRYPVRFLVAGAPYTLAGSCAAAAPVRRRRARRASSSSARTASAATSSRACCTARRSRWPPACWPRRSRSAWAGCSGRSPASTAAGWTRWSMRGAELFLALPWLYLLLRCARRSPSTCPPPQAFLMVVLVIGLVDWARPARLVRGVVLSARERNYVLAARGFGASDLYLIRRHIAPHTAGLVLTQAAPPRAAVRPGGGHALVPRASASASRRRAGATCWPRCSSTTCSSRTGGCGCPALPWFRCSSHTSPSSEAICRRARRRRR